MKRISLLSSALLLPTVLHAAQPLTNGNFETGDLTGWYTDSSNNARVSIVSRGSCFAGSDTTKIKVRGQYAARLSANTQGETDSIAVMRSDAFNAGDGFAFIALSQTSDALNGEEPTLLQVDILDADTDAILASQIFSTGQAKLNAGCPSTGEAGHFSSHYFSTRAYTGSGVKIQFSQNTRIKGSAFFTLIDQIVTFNQGEQPAFHSRPHAQAGMKLTSWGTPMLTSEGSFDGDQKLFDLGYTWYVNNESLALRNPCIGGLTNGDHTAVLYVNDGHHAMSDSIDFHINVLDNPLKDNSGTNNVSSADAEANANAAASVAAISETPAIVTGDPECQVDFDALTEENQYEVAVNDPNNIYVDTSKKTVVDNLTTPTEARTATSIPSTALTQGAYSLGASGIVWKPVSEGDHNLVVLTPSHFTSQGVSILDSAGNTIETAEFVGRTNGDRATYRFSRPGGNYAANSILRVGNTDYLIANPSVRVN
ncbi:MAG: hypothetical protein V3V09_03600 [Arenicellales bacterium]